MVDWLLKTNGLSVSEEGPLHDWLLKTDGVSLEKDHCMSVYEPCCILDNEVCRCSKTMLYSREGNTVDHAYSQTMLYSREGNIAHVYLQIMFH